MICRVVTAMYATNPLTMLTLDSVHSVVERFTGTSAAVGIGINTAAMIAKNQQERAMNDELRKLLADISVYLGNPDNSAWRENTGAKDKLRARITAALAEKEDGGDKVVCPCCKGSKKVDRVSFVDPTKTIKNSCHICRGNGYLINDASPAAGKEGVR